jgi:ABC-2 type transport system ATP-binding protein/lipopolysaccharide transport system ATP-binding protein
MPMQPQAQDWAVEVDGVSMRFNMSRERMDSAKEYLVRLMQRRLFFDEFWALQDVSFRVKRGSVFGLVGLNGAGKSTMLKIIAGVMKPSVGSVKVHGAIAPLIELGAGFDDELTARENVYLNGAVLGHDRAFMQHHYEEIISFSEMGEFQSVPLKNYSSGMRARLAFGIATIVQPDILIADEILSVGDFKFQEKCLDRIREMLSSGTTILFVSHSIDQVRNLCTETVWLEGGRVKMLGPTSEVCDAYGQM